MTTLEVRTLSDLLARSAARWPERLALDDCNYAELAKSVDLRARSLRLAHRVGEPVLIDRSAGPDWVAQFFAILEAGLVAVPVIPGMDPERVLRIASAASLPAGTAVLVVTSASERSPVAVPLSHANLLCDIDALLSMRPGRPGETLLSVLPPAHLFELTAGILAPIAIGARVVFCALPLPNRILDRMREQRVTRVMLVPALFEMLMKAIDDRAQLGEAFETFTVGGAALDPAWVGACRRMGIGLEIGYGLTEAGPIVSVGDALEMPLGSCGKPLPGIEVRIDPGGEICVRGPNVMAGYHGDKERTARVLRDGWLRTGDYGRRDVEGHLYIEGRLKDAIVPRSGETLWPEEIEEHYTSPLFRDVCVAPRRGPQGNDEPVLFVVPAVADRDALVREFRRLRSEASTRARLKEMEIMNRPLPRTADGRIRRRALALGLERELRALIEETTGEDLSRFGANDDLMAELVIDSLAALRVLAVVEHHFGVRFPDDRLADFHTLNGLMEVIEQHREEKSCASA
ncbi:MAG: AMP-binding protein [Planctomycetota bacterium]|jgi:long-subunit acyl-CoA synthetase (AMP-forming)